MTALWIYTKTQSKHRCQQLCGDEGVSLALKGFNVFYDLKSFEYMSGENKMIKEKDWALL